MKTVLRTFTWLALVVWLGALLFFPVTAWAALFATYDQGRVHNGLQVLSTNQALLLLYSAPAADP